MNGAVLPLPKQAVDDHVDIKLLEVGVLLPCAYKHDGLACLIRHGQSRPDLLIHRVKLGQDDPVNLVLLA